MLENADKWEAVKKMTEDTMKREEKIEREKNKPTQENNEEPGRRSRSE